MGSLWGSPVPPRAGHGFVVAPLSAPACPDPAGDGGMVALGGRGSPPRDTAGSGEQEPQHPCVGLFVGEGNKTGREATRNLAALKCCAWHTGAMALMDISVRKMDT